MMLIRTPDDQDPSFNPLFIETKNFTTYTTISMPPLSILFSSRRRANWGIWGGWGSSFNPLFIETTLSSWIDQLSCSSLSILFSSRRSINQEDKGWKDNLSILFSSRRYKMTIRQRPLWIPFNPLFIETAYFHLKAILVTRSFNPLFIETERVSWFNS